MSTATHSTSLEDGVAQVALEHYEQCLPRKGKPKDNEWTVYAALVATRSGEDNHHDDAWVVSCATGTKCTALRHEQGCILHDSHAEVLARRGLLRVLWKEILAVQQQASQVDGRHQQRSSSSTPAMASRSLLEIDTAPSSTSASTRPCFRLRSSIQLHLYVSDSPCGDASIYALLEVEKDKGNGDKKKNHDANNPQQQQPQQLQFTGAKVIVSPGTQVGLGDPCDHPTTLLEGCSSVAREPNAQLLGKLRTKSGRSNLAANQRSSSMSCSDKMVRWSVLGLQGAVLSGFIREPLRLASIVVSRDPRTLPTSAVGHAHNDGGDEVDATTSSHDHHQSQALQRAIPDRVVAAQQSLLGCPYKDKSSHRGGDNDLVSSFAKDVAPPRVYLVDQTFSRGKSVVLDQTGASSSEQSVAGHKRKRDEAELMSEVASSSKKSENGSSLPKKKFSPSGLSVHWQQPTLHSTSANDDEGVELVVGARGIRQGKKPTCTDDYCKLRSRLSRHALVQLALQVETVTKEDDASLPPDVTSYQEWKQRMQPKAHRLVSDLVRRQGPLAGWLSGGGDFALPRLASAAGRRGQP